MKKKRKLSEGKSLIEEIKNEDEYAGSLEPPKKKKKKNKQEESEKSQDEDETIEELPKKKKKKSIVVFEPDMIFECDICKSQFSTKYNMLVHKVNFILKTI
jgi:polyphosphate kinase 2 (PPK2 family)